ncbi:hypothetical protein [Mesorhizobium sp. WSM4884]|uniref:hypothetical protein n=1 Tax=Mesorhizobium sp. WSM4884 TaxID=3038542 RepID=UPI002416A4B0|nr:hypothetical protein [Mesorhizobium sp. WSM4884]MDG4884330.1 hypothetical protein [Mesorhizobium sp. WSM4884]
MSVFVVSFRIADEQSIYGTYSERWSSVNDAVQNRAVGRNYWKQTTSFFALQATETSASALASAINVNSKFDPDKDLLLVVNLSSKDFKVIGVNKDADIDAIMALR